MIASPRKALPRNPTPVHFGDAESRPVKLDERSSAVRRLVLSVPCPVGQDREDRASDDLSSSTSLSDVTRVSRDKGGATRPVANGLRHSTDVPLHFIAVR
jgi:hypothetical protein